MQPPSPTVEIKRSRLFAWTKDLLHPSNVSHKVGLRGSGPVLVVRMMPGAITMNDKTFYTKLLGLERWEGQRPFGRKTCGMMVVIEPYGGSTE